MDYILFGLGTGATLALVGGLFRELGPRIRDRTPDEGEVLSARDMISRMAWARFCAACGAALAFAGIIVMLATVGAAFWDPSDNDGFRLILIAYAIVTVLMLVWAGIFVRLFGVVGIVRPREKQAPTPVPPQPEKAQATASDGDEAEAAQGPRAKSFVELASSRGGLGRFAAFLRRDAAPVGATPQAELRRAETPGTALAMADDERDALVGPSIADLPDAGEGEAKRLELDDPLVTNVMGEIQAVRAVEEDIEASVVSSDSMAAHEEHATVAVGTAEPEAPAASLTPEEQALERLRRQRLARLAGERKDP